MHAKTALAVAGAALAIPSAALAATDDTDHGALRPSGKLTHNPLLEERLVREHVRLAAARRA